MNLAKLPKDSDTLGSLCSTIPFLTKKVNQQSKKQKLFSDHFDQEEFLSYLLSSIHFTHTLRLHRIDYCKDQHRSHFFPSIDRDFLVQ